MEEIERAEGSEESVACCGGGARQEGAESRLERAQRITGEWKRLTRDDEGKPLGSPRERVRNADVITTSGFEEILYNALF